jgi:hypothetical protein
MVTPFVLEVTVHQATMMGQDAYRKISAIRNCVTRVTTELFLHAQVWWWHEAVTSPRGRERRLWNICFRAAKGASADADQDKQFD